MFKRLLKPVISSNQLIQNVPGRTCDNIKWFSLSSVHSKVNKKAFGLRPPANPYSQYFKVVFPRVVDEHPNSGVNEMVKFIAEEWNQLGEAEKKKYTEMWKDKKKEYEADDVKQELENMRKEIEEIVHDRPTRYRSWMQIYYMDVVKNSKVSSKVSLKIASKELKALNEKERSILQKEFAETQQDFEKWKQKVKRDGRAKIMKNLESILDQKLKRLEFDKPKRHLGPHLCYFYENFKGSSPKGNSIQFQESMKQWNNLSAAEREPYYETLHQYRKDMIVWKEKTSQDGRKNLIEAIKKLLYQLKM